MSKTAKVLAWILIATLAITFLAGFMGIVTSYEFDILAGLMMIVSGIWLGVLVLRS